MYHINCHIAHSNHIFTFHSKLPLFLAKSPQRALQSTSGVQMNTGCPSFHFPSPNMISLSSEKFLPLIRTKSSPLNGGAEINHNFPILIFVSDLQAGPNEFPESHSARPGRHRGLWAEFLLAFVSQNLLFWGVTTEYICSFTKVVIFSAGGGATDAWYCFRRFPQ